MGVHRRQRSYAKRVTYRKQRKSLLPVTGRSTGVMKRTNAVMVRLDDAQVRELDALAETVGIPASTLAHAAVLGMLRGFRRNGRMSLPLELVPALDPLPADDAVLNEAPRPRRRTSRPSGGSV